MNRYASSPEGTEPKAKTVDKTVDKRIDALESKVSSLMARIDRMQSIIDEVSRSNRKLASNLDTVTAVVRSKK
jgi:predicted RNase H-like nuclease (RuvC/YqgF family)